MTAAPQSFQQISALPVAYCGWHPDYGWRPDLAAKDAQVATAVVMRSISGAAQQGWSIKPLYAASGDVRAAVIKECAKAVEGESLQSETGMPEDVAYDQAIRDAAEAVRALSQSPTTDAAATTMVVGRVTGKLYEGDQCSGMSHAICHACGMGYKCFNLDCPNDKPNPALGNSNAVGIA